MAYKLGFILSMIFLVGLFMLVGDLLSIQVIYTNLDAVSVTAGHIISTKGAITQEVVDLVLNEAGAYIVEIGESKPLVGEIIEYKISKSYKSLIIDDEEMEIAVRRSIVIGYYS